LNLLMKRVQFNNIICLWSRHFERKDADGHFKLGSKSDMTNWLLCTLYDFHVCAFKLKEP
jgi:hypothetical protein